MTQHFIIHSYFSVKNIVTKMTSKQNKRYFTADKFSPYINKINCEYILLYFLFYLDFYQNPVNFSLNRIYFSD